jgi:hypothetical protein
MTVKTKQFKGTGKPKTFFDRKIRPAGYTRYVALGKVLPEDWEYVRLTVINKTPNTIELLIQKLLGAQNHAQVKTDNTTSQQNS